MATWTAPTDEQQHILLLTLKCYYRYCKYEYKFLLILCVLPLVFGAPAAAAR